jgi:hypothetical protein
MKVWQAKVDELLQKVSILSQADGIPEVFGDSSILIKRVHDKVDRTLIGECKNAFIVRHFVKTLSLGFFFPPS